MTAKREAHPIAGVSVWVSAVELFVPAVSILARGTAEALTDDLTEPGGVPASVITLMRSRPKQPTAALDGHASVI